jgi:hypothetical protein
MINNLSTVTNTNGTNIIIKKKEPTTCNFKFNDPDPQLYDDVDEPIIITSKKAVKVKKIKKTEKDNNNDNKNKNKKNNKKNIKNNPKVEQEQLEPVKEVVQVVNPFFVGIDGGSLLTLKIKEIYQNYSHIYIMCLKDGFVLDDNSMKIMMNIFCLNVVVNDLHEACKNLVLVKAPNDIVKNYRLKKKSNLIKKDILSLYFPRTDGQEYELDEIVTAMLEMTESSCRTYIDMYRVTPLNQIQDMISLSSYYNKMSIVSIESKVNDALRNIGTGAYWKDSKNCNFNMDWIFNQRSLSYNGHRLDQIRYATISGAKTLNNLMTCVGPKKRFTKAAKIRESDYLEGIHEMNENDRVNCTSMKSEHMNIYQVLRDSDNRTFYATMDEGQFPFTKDQIADIFDNIVDEKYRFQLLNTFLTSKEYCHFVINNKRVLKRNSDLFQKYKPLYAYLIGYAWVTFYLEESIFTTRSTKKHRFVFDIDTAKELPVFPFSMENVHNNPYVTLLLSRDLIDPKTNCMSINSLRNYDKYYGLASREEALMRFNQFVSGDKDEDIFRDLNPKIFAFSGSIIPACLMKLCPLVDTCTSSDMSFNDVCRTYFAHFYGEADIDVMCGVSTMAEFMVHGTKFLEVLTKNLGCKRSDLILTPQKKPAVIISKHFFKECIDDLNTELGTQMTTHELIKIFEQGLSNDDADVNTLPPEIIEYFHVDYTQEKKNSIKKWNALQTKNNIVFDNDLVKAFNNISEKKDLIFKTISYDVTSETQKRYDHEIYFFVNDFRDEDNQVPKEKNYLVFKFSESIKYKITSTKLRKTMDFFKVEPVDPFKTVARFHKPCVRAYLQGNTFYMLPSFITAMMSTINIDYKYFAGSRDPIEIINKYRMRGFSVILNVNEKKAMYMYNKNVDTTNGMFKVNNEEEAFGMKDLNDKIFRPGMYKLGLPKEIYNISNHEYINSVEQLKTVYQKDCDIPIKDAPFDILRFTTIGANGTVTPYQSWVAEAFYNFVQDTCTRK